MAPFFLAIYVLVFCGILHHTDGECNVSCTTDYISGLNCSCSGSEETLSCEIQANCSDEMGSTDWRCVIRPPQQWCSMQPENFFFYTNPDTTCILKAKQVNLQSSREEYTSSAVLLDQMIKPKEPFNLTLTDNTKEFNLSWEMAYKEQENVDLFSFLMYRVRLRPKDNMEEEKMISYSVREDRRYQEIQCEQLSPGTVYVVDVQASVNPQMKNLNGETLWSEWSEGVECTCPSLEPEQLNRLLFYLMVPLGLFLGFFGFSWICNRGLLKKSCLFQYAPDPHNFFKPLYHTYQGDFKKWVGPVFTFSSFDVLEKSAPLQVLSEKQQAAVPQQRPLLRDQGSGGSSLVDLSLLSLINPDLSKRYFLGGSGLGLAHSGGHISMDTVTVSGQEGSMSDFHEINHRAVEIPDEAEDPEAGRREGSEGQGFDDWQLQANDAENGEELSLESFGSNEHSDYGYPQIGLDLDTIDSGFLESDCSSPVSSECERGEGMDAPLLGDNVGTHSNYVKQWVAFIPASGENSNSL
ncbi:hypothetical protein QTP70_030372 [Hemibagrus guttatus]|uniref:Fibronectin type-III domain-containing protein n=1 Tax=Hemibagrus guttatus TaxID=175788 RepID=A0AAE0UNB6_9TELE|nr:hypothetical protein QTP70_030372 [Hemibagrus guttatus]KAK3532726.1 hypothetical protein QTP86_028092 [Hemibagrus guttatus]